MTAGPSGPRTPRVAAGDRFGKLIALEEVERRGQHRMWTCRCDCDTKVTVRQSDLLRRTRSCGCTGGRPIKRDGIDRGYPRSHSRVSTARGPASGHHCTDCAEWADTWSYVRGCPSEQWGPTKPTEPDSGISPYCEHVEHYQPRCYACHARLDRARRVTVRQVRARMLNGM